MGITFSCPFVSFEDLDGKVESYLVRKKSVSISFNDQITPKSRFLKSFGTGNIILEGTLSYKRRELEAKIALKTLLFDKEDNKKIPDNLCNKENRTLPAEYGKHRDQAAVKLQKTYKSFRTRRQLADCAVLVEQRWWKLLDSVELNQSSISFFDTGKPQTAVSRWSRAINRVAKVGKGLSRDGKARKLALQHWLEAIDPRHRYGHNLRFYYTEWLEADSKQPFFYWLDVGEGKEVNLERCPRSKLQQDCIKYLGPAVWPQSGHYHPTEENFEAFMVFLKQQNVDLAVVQKFTNYEEEAPFDKKECGINIRNNLSIPDFNQCNEESNLKISDTMKNDSTNKDSSRQSRGLRPKIAVEIPEKHCIFELFKETGQEREQKDNTPPVETPLDGFETPEEYLSDTECSVSKKNLFDHENEEEYKEPVPKEQIMKRINSHIGMKSYQLAQQLSCRWTTGAGPRIGCMRDYPSELQFRVMEEMQLSPRPAFPTPPSKTSARCYTPTIFSREINESKRPVFIL